MIETSEKKLKKRSFEQILRSKQIYEKHALRYKQLDYPVEMAKRMLAYSSCLTKVLAEYGEKK